MSFAEKFGLWVTAENEEVNPKGLTRVVLVAVAAAAAIFGIISLVVSYPWLWIPFVGFPLGLWILWALDVHKVIPYLGSKLWRRVWR